MRDCIRNCASILSDASLADTLKDKIKKENKNLHLLNPKIYNKDPIQKQISTIIKLKDIICARNASMK